MGLESEEVTNSWGTFLNEKFHNLNSSPRVTRMIRYKKMRRRGQQYSW